MTPREFSVKVGVPWSKASGQFHRGYCSLVVPFRRGGKTHPLYDLWVGMIQRCYNPNHKSYSQYGAQGIRVCTRWLWSFSAFIEDMGGRPAKHYSIDRLDSRGWYTPENCRWATPIQQARNCKSNVLLTYQNVTKPIAQWAEELGVSRYRLYGRRRYGWTDEEIITGARLPKKS